MALTMGTRKEISNPFTPPRSASLTSSAAKPTRLRKRKPLPPASLFSPPHPGGLFLRPGIAHALVAVITSG
jgi:hypothetical protein